MIYNFACRIINCNMYVVDIINKGFLVFRINKFGNKEIAFTDTNDYENATLLYRVSTDGQEVQSRAEVNLPKILEEYLLNGNFMLNYTKQCELILSILEAISDGDESWYNPKAYEFNDYESRNTAVGFIRDNNEIWVEETEDNLRYIFKGDSYMVLNPTRTGVRARNYTDKYILDIVSKAHDWNKIGNTYVIDYVNPDKIIIQLEEHKRVEVPRKMHKESFTFKSEKKYEMEITEITYEYIKENYTDYCEIIKYIEYIKEGNLIPLYEIDDFVGMLTRLINNIAENKVYPSKMATLYEADNDKYRIVEMLAGNYIIITPDTTNQFIFAQRLYRNNQSPVVYWDTTISPGNIEKVVLATNDSIELIETFLTK